MNFEIAGCGPAHQSGVVCQYPDTRTRVVSEPGCQYCQEQRPGPAPTFNQMPPSCAVRNHNGLYPGPLYQTVAHAYLPAAQQRNIPYGRSYHQEYQPQGNLRSTSQPNRLLVNPPEDYRLPGLGQYEHSAHWDVPSNRPQSQAPYPQVQPYEGGYTRRPEHKYHDLSGPSTYRARRTYTDEEEQEKLAAAEEANLQRALQESRREHELNKVKRACSGQGRRISALEDQMDRDRERAQHDREERGGPQYKREEEQYRADLEQYLAEKAAWEASEREARPAGEYLENPRGLSTGEKPSFMPSPGRKEKEVWIRDVRKVDGKLVEYRRKLKSWEYELR
ncbi:hypothetical protein LTR84_005446 [Exophiala bonariae]|uniref:Uncharacterized protein n=1 Tax=Exophiala bonariae TaxID=1690606 RepID=A0AAV9N411_9EURO|nr:hypothetical protein LTR84_005446 [Exophiala bonariae]